MEFFDVPLRTNNKALVTLGDSFIEGESVKKINVELDEMERLANLYNFHCYPILIVPQEFYMSHELFLLLKNNGVFHHKI